MSESIQALAEAAKNASRKIASTSNDQRNQALEAVAQALEQAAPQILAANAEDMQRARAAFSRSELSRALVDRLELTATKLASMIEGVRAVAALPDPIGRVLERTELDTGLLWKK